MEQPSNTRKATHTPKRTAVITIAAKVAYGDFFYSHYLYIMMTMTKRLLLFAFAGLLLLNPRNALATQETNIIMNEIAWMGTTGSANDEWVELFNSTEKTISLTGWILQSVDGRLKIPLRGSLGAKSFYLLERTDDNSVTSVKANIIYKGALSNGGMYLELRDGIGNIVDTADYAVRWPAGNNTTKQTMERAGDGWHTSKEAGGTPKATNSEGVQPNSTATEDLPNNQKTDTTTIVDAAALGESIPHNKNPWFLFLAAIGLTIISATAVIFAKLKLLKKHS